MPTSPFYTIETTTFSTLTFIFLIYFSSLLLSLRFTPRRKIPEVRFYCTPIAFTCVCINLPRSCDLSSIYGLIDYQTNALLYSLCTSLNIFAACIFIRSIAHTLYVQLQQQMERFYTPLLFAPPTVYAFGHLILNSLSYHAVHSRDDLLLSKLIGFKGLLFHFTLFVILSVELVIFVRLRAKLMAFIQALAALHPKRMAAPIATQIALPSGVVAANSLDRVIPMLTDIHIVKVNQLAVLLPLSPRATMAVSISSHHTFSSSSSHEARVSSLRAAVRTLTIMTIAIAFFCLLGQINLHDSYIAASGALVSHAEMYGPEPDTYQLILGHPSFVHQAILALMAWYLWSPLQWTNQIRQEKGLHFWHTLIHGVDEKGDLTSSEGKQQPPNPSPSPQIRKMTAKVTSIQLAPVTPTTENFDLLMQPTWTTVTIDAG